ncbi:retropepsin-like aspartic protease [Flaviaesturariibacter amylovorans]|uniref:Uncharacterized protein n=1 Tax=Flaviaesturariibacter amylovorans TaxID=1084520 RepID=A0ABP8G7B5_9BACT
MLRSTLFTVFACSVLWANGQDKTYRVPFYENRANVLEIDIRINGTEARFIFDPGATMLSFGQRFYNELVNGMQLSDADIKYRTKTKLADGSLADVAVVRIKSFRIGDYELRDAEAMVLSNQQAPLLLGQSIIRRFSEVTIDRNRRQIVLKETANTLLPIPKLRLIPCSADAAAETARLLKSVSGSIVEIQDISQEPKVPPANALKRIYNKITVRYFDGSDAAAAKALGERFAELGYKPGQITLEDMTPYFNSALPGYFEIWINN